MTTSTTSAPAAPAAPADIILKTDALGRVRIDRDRREAILAKFDRSAMSGAAFARQHGIKYTTFANWLQARRKAAREAAAPKATFLEAEAIPATSATSALPTAAPLHVELPCGARLSVTDETGASLAAALLRAL